MTKILLIRHATTSVIGKRIVGRMAGVHLNEEGYLQAQRLAERLKSLPIQFIFSSPLERAIETAEPIAKIFRLPVQILNELTEIDFGMWTNAEIEALKQQLPFRLFNEFRSTASIPGGEGMLAAQARIVACLQNLCIKHSNETIAIITHADMIKAAVAHYAGIHLDLMQRIEIDPASVSIVHVYQETARIWLLNGTGQLID